MCLVMPLTVGALSANCYLVVNPETRECVFCDPGGEPERLIALSSGYTPRGVILTHGHFDHMAGADGLCSHFHIPLYLHQADVPLLKDPQTNVSALFGSPMTVETPAIPLQGGQVLALAGMEFRVLHTPGHTEGGVCYLLPDHQGVLSGDTLMAHGYGRTDFPGGDMRKLRESLRTLFYLTPRMRLYPGHEELGYVGREDG